ncbi:MAG TPA: nucleoside triphosphate pyrophosphohydrolase [Steroidobacteraceae bacterium]|nr:nucleoside triphosphate pyrophosphohydrolase [Steroidobacteraceae bacterium]
MSDANEPPAKREAASVPADPADAAGRAGMGDTTDLGGLSGPGEALQELLALMRRLRDPEHGCPWDREQTFATIAAYTLEEAYEVLDAIEGGSPAKLRDELGDLLFQVVFHAQMAAERGWFDFEAVAHGIHDKLVRRHPHVFGPDREAAAGAHLYAAWEAQKARERAQDAAARGEAAGTLADVPKALPALTRAVKLSRRAARVGFDWTDPRDVRAKVSEELAEVDEAVRAQPSATASAHVVEEIGDLLFAISNWGRHLGVDPEAALRAANAKFERRFAVMEERARARGRALSSLSLPEWEDLWSEAKRGEAGG